MSNTQPQSHGGFQELHPGKCHPESRTHFALWNPHWSSQLQVMVRVHQHLYPWPGAQPKSYCCMCLAVGLNDTKSHSHHFFAEAIGKALVRKQSGRERGGVEPGMSYYMIASVGSELWIVLRPKMGQQEFAHDVQAFTKDARISSAAWIFRCWAASLMEGRLGTKTLLKHKAFW